jgi:hypothetical protein
MLGGPAPDHGAQTGARSIVAVGFEPGRLDPAEDDVEPRRRRPQLPDQHEDGEAGEQTRDDCEPHHDRRPTGAASAGPPPAESGVSGRVSSSRPPMLIKVRRCIHHNPTA